MNTGIHAAPIMEYYKEVASGESLDLSVSFGTPLRIDAGPDVITITEKAVDGDIYG